MASLSSKSSPLLSHTVSIQHIHSQILSRHRCIQIYHLGATLNDANSEFSTFANNSGLNKNEVTYKSLFSEERSRTLPNINSEPSFENEGNDIFVLF